MISSVIFDLDDTLCDYAHAKVKALDECALLIQEPHREMFRESYDAIEPVLLRMFESGKISSSVYRRLRFLFPLQLCPIGDTDSAEIAHVMNQRYMDYANNNVKLFPDVEDCLLRLSQLGLKLYILTNGPSDGQRRKIASLGIEEYFNRIFIGEEIGVSKPDPASFRFVIESIGEKPENMVMVGDSYENDIEPAKRLGLKVYYLDRRAGSDSRGSISTLRQINIAKFGAS